MVRWNLNDALPVVGNLIVIFVSLVGLIASFFSSVYVHVSPGPGYIGPIAYVSVGVPPQFLLVMAVGSALALIGAFASSMELSARILMGIGSLSTLSYSIVGILVYYEIVEYFYWIFERRTFQNQLIIYVDTGSLFIIMLFDLATLTIYLTSMARTRRKLLAMSEA